ncbi:MAG: 4a-hydroxytetrahydrobiopterin dehydratase [Hyphomicrobiales bacterium]|nr:4a-hydroxytetrahydrobiopterin dehydratase [Rickettsiales bacterium]MCP5361328.1 4a-hydroxytetrahydrobiopterin dehydratase [Hyphomicrobiales bacterium]
MALEQQQCIPCEGGVKRLDEAQASTMLLQTPGWEMVDDARKIELKCVFKNFAEALAFVNKVGQVAEEQNHHPDILFGWGYAKITIQTHAIAGLHENDFVLAAKINTLLK